MEIIVLDTRPQHREAELARLAAAPTIGVEVTGAADLAAACVMNVDGQHRPGAPGTSAARMVMEMVREETWPHADITRFATVRPDRDAFAAIAIAAWSTPGQMWDVAIAARVARVADADEAAPRTPGPVDPGTGEVDPFAALGAAVVDHQLTPERRCELTWEWIRTGAFAGQEAYAERVAALRADVARLEGEVTLAHGGRVAVVETTSPMGVVAGYRRADVVVAMNPAHRWPQGHVTRKATICQQPGSGTNLAGLADELNARIPDPAGGEKNTWGGVAGATLGSPQGEDPTMSLGELVGLVGRWLRPTSYWACRQECGPIDGESCPYHGPGELWVWSRDAGKYRKAAG